MNEFYASTVRLLLSVLPDVFRSEQFALKGGTAINLFVRDMPRLSVDIDVVFVRRDASRQESMDEISNEIESISERLTQRGLVTKILSTQEAGSCALLVNDRRIQVKIEVNHVFRGTVLPVDRQRLLRPVTAEAFSVELHVPVLATDELYGSKLVAAFDRQHPRDLFDLWQMHRAEGYSAEIIECFVTYLAGHNRPLHEVLFANPIDISFAYETSFAGMTRDHVDLQTLLEARQHAFRSIPALLSDRQKTFLRGLAWAEPDWSLLQCPHASELPALRWKLMNLQQFRERHPERFEAQARELESLLA